MGIFGKLAFDEGANTITLLAVRFSLAGLAFWGIVLATGGTREIRALGRRDLLMGLGLGTFGYAIQAGCYFAALSHIDVSLLSLLLYTYPAIVAVSAALLGRDRLDRRRVLALFLASSGLLLVLAGAGAGSFDVVGAALGMGAATTYSVYILVSEGIAGRLRPELLAALVCTGAAVPLALGSALLGELHLGAVTPLGWLWLVLLVLVATVAAIGFFFAGLRRVGPSAASILSTLEPVVTVFLAHLIFNEVLGPTQLLGAVCVLAAVPVLSARRRARAAAVTPT